MEAFPWEKYEWAQLPWLRQPYDTDDSFEAFVVFRDTRPRKIRASAWDIPKHMEWCRANLWRERAAAWDAYLDEVHTNAVAKEVQESSADKTKRHMELLQMTHELVAREIAKHLKLSMTNDAPGGVLPPHVLAKFMDMSVRLERLIMGEPTERIGVDDEGPDLSALTPEELVAYRAMMLKAARRPE